jgi:hypothetical protein
MKLRIVQFSPNLVDVSYISEPSINRYPVLELMCLENVRIVTCSFLRTTMFPLNVLLYFHIYFIVLPDTSQGIANLKWKVETLFQNGELEDAATSLHATTIRSDNAL